MAYNSKYTGAQIDEGVGKGLNAVQKGDGNASHITFSDGETFQQKYDSGELTGPAGNTGAPGATGPAGAAGQDATINGVNALTIEAGGNVQLSQVGSVLTIGAKPKALSVTLTAAGWDSSTKQQSMAVAGVLADETKQLIQPVPAAASQAAYIEAGILCTGQAANSLTFTAETVPTANLTVYVVITEVTG